MALISAAVQLQSKKNAISVNSSMIIKMPTFTKILIIELSGRCIMDGQDRKYCWLIIVCSVLLTGDKFWKLERSCE